MQFCDGQEGARITGISGNNWSAGGDYLNKVLPCRAKDHKEIRLILFMHSVKHVCQRGHSAAEL